MRAFALPASFLLGALWGVTMLPPAAAAQATPPAPFACNGPAEAVRFDAPLANTGRKLAAGKSITIVAVGSSSTAGAGASSSAASYPSRLEIELKQRFPSASFRVLNRGVNGEEAGDMLARLDATVLSEQPDLVVWQVGTNSVLRDHSIDAVAGFIREGLSRIKQAGADVILMDPQFAPKVLAKPDVQRMVDLIGAAAKAENVDLFRRFAVMRHWVETEKIDFADFLSGDALHLNDWSYACIAKLLSGAIAEAATRATAVAGAGTRL
jgi:acyl-CoA thioesterase I